MKPTPSGKPSASASNATSRRDFLRNATAASVALPYVLSSRSLGGPTRTAPSDRIQVALIGCGEMGRANLRECAQYDDVEVTAACDVWKARLDAVVAQYPNAKGYLDYQELLQQENVDAVIIATPPHWHCLQAIDAARAGKHIYLQKPMTRHLSESLAVKNAVNKHGVVCQVGTQIHASANYRRVVEWIRSQRLGNISVARCFLAMNQGPDGIGNPPPTDCPAGLDWDRWMGPLPERPFHPLIVKSAYDHGSFMDTSGGWTPGMAPHIIDLPFWALDLGIPTTTSSTGGRFTIKDCGDSPDVQDVLWQFPGFTLTWSMTLASSFGFDFGSGNRQLRLGTYFQGVRGTLLSDYNSHKIIPEGDFLTDVSPPEEPIPPSPGHEREWLDCIISGKSPSCDPNYHYKIDAAINLANLSLQLGRSIRFDQATEQIVDDAEATKLATPEYRAPWRFPAEYLART